MARSREVKIGIDYFSHDTDIMQDPKIKLIKAKHGLIGYAIYLRLLEELYREKGYYLQLSEDVDILFCDDNNLDYNVYISVLNDCINKDLFNKMLYEKYKILTSKRTQLNYASATIRRKEMIFVKEFMLVDIKKYYDPKKVNVNILSYNVYISKQSKEKEKEKVKEIESKEQEPKKNNIVSTVVENLNSVCKTNYKDTTQKTIGLIEKRIADGATLEDFKTVIRKKYNDWVGTKQQIYLRPETLFGNKFESYLNQIDENYNGDGENENDPDRPFG